MLIMGCGDKDKTRRTKERVTQMAEKFEQATGEETIIVMKMSVRKLVCKFQKFIN